mmetsp:Transcript_21831/g.44861  ORF Transcript_21831/g.44861 Transcript_21831/m.44861 type:complete len:202 (+) Transcript_21831:1095-1700(+)
MESSSRRLFRISASNSEPAVSRMTWKSRRKSFNFSRKKPTKQVPLILTERAAFCILLLSWPRQWLTSRDTMCLLSTRKSGFLPLYLRPTLEHPLAEPHPPAAFALPAAPPWMSTWKRVEKRRSPSLIKTNLVFRPLETTAKNFLLTLAVVCQGGFTRADAPPGNKASKTLLTTILNVVEEPCSGASRPFWAFQSPVLMWDE